MTIRLVESSNPILKKRCPESFTMRHASLPGDMLELMIKSKGAGLAAPQVGYLYRLFVTYWGEVFINPVIEDRGPNKEWQVEGCLSLPGQSMEVWRYCSVKVNGKWYNNPIMARVIQHEMDHLDGITILDTPRLGYGRAVGSGKGLLDIYRDDYGKYDPVGGTSIRPSAG